jgi:hypothetical protein
VLLKSTQAFVVGTKVRQIHILPLLHTQTGPDVENQIQVGLMWASSPDPLTQLFDVKYS